MSIKKWTKLNKDNKEAIKQFSENYTEVMTNLMQPQIEIATLEEAIKKLSGNYGIITESTRRQKEMVDGCMGEVAKQLEESSQAKSAPDLTVAQSLLSAALVKNTSTQYSYLSAALVKNTSTQYSYGPDRAAPGGKKTPPPPPPKKK